MRVNGDDITSSIDLHQVWIDSARAELKNLRKKRSEAGRAPQPSPDAGIRDALEESLAGYTLGETISRGGQGVVIKAVQKATRRDVAVKVLREGPLASEQERSRFEREVQILAQLKHANIVTVLDSGSAAGTHYFIMDYIPGWPLDEFVRRHALPVRQRLLLFVKICRAINVAHLRGIIHRDLKPGNIRVDPSGEPHILDFGLAKVSDFDELATSRTELRTLTGQFIGSLPWAAPEQISGRPEHVELRTDVYALGVLLYQTLTGRFPYDVTGSFREALENICSADPPRPSSVQQALDDELDHIVLKCLRKSPEDRYQSAGDVARDIERYLAGEPIEAKRDSHWYLLRKTIRRHRVSAAIGGLVILLIATVAVGLGVLYQRERQASDRERTLRTAAEQAEARAISSREEAERQARAKTAVNEFFCFEVLAAAAPDRLGREATIHAAMNAAADRVDDQFQAYPLIAGQIHYAMGTSYFRLGEVDKAIEHLASSVRRMTEALGPQHEDVMHARNDLARAYENAGAFEDARSHFEACLAYWRRTRGESDEETLKIMVNLGWLHLRLGDVKTAEGMTRSAYEVALASLGPDNELTRNARGNLGIVYLESDRPELAEPHLRADLESSRRLLGNDDPATLVAMGNMAELLRTLGRTAEAEELMVESLESRKRVLGPAHPSTILQMNNLAMFYGRQQENERAAVMLEEAIEQGINGLGDSHPTVVSMTSNLAAVYDRLERHVDAEPLHRTALDKARGYLPGDHVYVGLYLSRLGRCLMSLDRASDAEAPLLQGYEILQKGGEESQARETADALAELNRQLNRGPEADAWRAKGNGAAARPAP